MSVRSVISSDVARQAANEVLPVLVANAAIVDQRAAFPSDGMQALRDSGLLGLLVPTEFGGFGGNAVDLVDVAQTLASGCLSTAMIWAMHCQQVDALVNYAAPELAHDVLPRIARGEVYVASVTTEPGKGGHLLRAEAALVERGPGAWLERVAPIVTGGADADGFLITMRASPQASENQLSLVYADRENLQIDLRGGWDPLGMRGTHSVGLKLSGSIEERQLVGQAGGFRTIATESMIVMGHLGWAACWLGAARSAMADVIDLARSPDRPRGLDTQSDLAAERIARTRIDLELVAAYLERVCEEVVAYRSAGRSLDNVVTQIHLNTLKVAAAEFTYRAVDRLIQIVGLAHGYLRTSAIPLERHLRDLRSASLNYSNDRLLTATGALALLDRSVRLA